MVFKIDGAVIQGRVSPGSVHRLIGAGFDHAAGRLFRLKLLRRDEMVRDVRDLTAADGPRRIHHYGTQLRKTRLQLAQQPVLPGGAGPDQIKDLSHDGTSFAKIPIYYTCFRPIWQMVLPAAFRKIKNPGTVSWK